MLIHRISTHAHTYWKSNAFKINSTPWGKLVNANTRERERVCRWVPFTTSISILNFKWHARIFFLFLFINLCLDLWMPSVWIRMNIGMSMGMGMKNNKISLSNIILNHNQMDGKQRTWFDHFVCVGSVFHKHFGRSVENRRRDKKRAKNITTCCLLFTVHCLHKCIFPFFLHFCRGNPFNDIVWPKKIKIHALPYVHVTLTWNYFSCEISWKWKMFFSLFLPVLRNKCSDSCTKSIWKSAMSFVFYEINSLSRPKNNDSHPLEWIWIMICYWMNRTHIRITSTFAWNEEIMKRLKNKLFHQMCKFLWFLNINYFRRGKQQKVFCMENTQCKWDSA